MTIPTIICDDSQLARKSLQRLLPRDWDITLFETSNGQQALDTIKRQHVGVLFLDLQMPIVDGWQVLDTIRRERLETMVIVVTGDRQTQTRIRALQAGALDVLVKPVCEEQLNQVLTRFGLYRPSFELAGSR